MSEKADQADFGVKTQVLLALERIGFGADFETADDPVDLLIHFALVVLANDAVKIRAIRPENGRTSLGRPRKERAHLKPVELYLQTQRIREFFEKNEGIRLSQRDVVKLMIQNDIIPWNNEISHIEKQVSAGKRAMNELRKQVRETRAKYVDK